VKFNILDLLHRDDLQQQVEHAEGNKEKEGQLRAGNAGIMLPDGNLAGSCPRLAYLRLKGIDLPADEDRAVMFEFGRQNEVILIDKLKRQFKDSLVITGDDVNSINWKLPSGRTVSGRPDIVIADKSGKPLVVLEAKMICSLWTGKSVRLENAPKLPHLIQAAHYASKLACPCKLVYIQSVDFQIPWGGAIKWPEQGSPEGACIEYKVRDQKVGKGPTAKTQRVACAQKLLPGRKVYDVEMHEGSIRYRDEQSSSFWTVTPITQEGIEGYYEHIDRMEAKGDLGPRPLALKGCGDFESYVPCDYCDLKAACDKYEGKPVLWLAEAAKVAAEKNK
jgi:hypothetical protein